jgi:hypothetical protein
MPAGPAADVLLVLLRWVHSLATVAFLGVIVALVLNPTLRDEGSKDRFKELSDITLIVFLVTGAILSVDRLSQGAGWVYGGTLALKIALSLLAYQFAFKWRRAGLPADAREARLLIGSGAGVILLAAVLKGIFESGLRLHP